MSEPKKRSLRHLDVSQLSPSMKARNPHLFEPPADFGQMVARQPGEPSEVPAMKTAGKRRSEMNKTEARFARLLEARLARGEIESFEYEGLTLRWPDGMRYTPDMVVYERVTLADDGRHLLVITLVEVKGAYGWAKDIVKFRAARDKWGDRYRFEFWQEVDGQWKETR